MEVGCGWLGWTPDQVLDADMTDVELAYGGKVKMLQACYGGGTTSKADVAPPSANEILSFARAHNHLRRQQGA